MAVNTDGVAKDRIGVVLDVKRAMEVALERPL